MEMKNNHISYVEFKAKDLVAIKEFYTEAFAWEFKDYGPEYCSFTSSGVMGGFEHTNGKIVNGALVVLYHEDLDSIKDTVVRLTGSISKDIFSFPGGRRFHFIDPSGNELAIWSDK